MATKRLNKDWSSLRPPLTKRRFWLRQLAPLAILGPLLLPGALAGCGGDLLGGTRAFPGAVVADEPRAAVVGRDILAQGGTAADAAVAAYFAMSVTLPTSAGLGGGGACVGYDPERKRFEAIDFQPRPTAGGNMAVPTNVRGMALLHARLGKLPWNQLLGPAEQMARVGTESSRAFVAELQQAGGLDRAIEQIYSGRDGQPLREGEKYRQADLASSIARIRTNGAGEMYNGQLARQLVEGAQAAGGDLTLDDLRRFVPQRSDPMRLAYGNNVLLLPPPSLPGAAIVSDMAAMVATTNYRSAAQPERVHIVAAAVRRAMAAQARRNAGQTAELGTPARGRMLMADYRAQGAGAPIPIDLPPDAAPPAASFVVLDGYKSAVACTVTQGGWFGLGRLAPGTGIALAAPPPRGGVLSMVPLLLVNTNTERSLVALGSVDTAYAAAAAVEVLLGVLIEDRRLEDVIGRPRLGDDGQTVLLEPEADDTATSLERLGYRLREVPRIGRVNAIFCTPQLAAADAVCEARPDPRTAGLAVGAR
ncbi:MAG: gamma-glutamyltransferase [Alphaproteobacteria bacterium]|nr:gamma-glutamyltransferase [Alphaproteobacteria bacterium]